jgi:hypothetical protein
VTLVVAGDAGGAWTVRRAADDRWTLYDGVPAAPATAVVRMEQDTAWRLFTRALTPDYALRRVQVEGDAALGRRVLDMVAILA